MTEELDVHCRSVARAIADGRLTPFLGAGANLCGRPDGAGWNPWEAAFLPSGDELARYLAREFDYPAHLPVDLVRVSQYIAITDGLGPLDEKLHQVFDKDFPPSPLHELLASLPELRREHRRSESFQLLVTANYDDALERAFKARGEPFDLLTYMTARPFAGKFVHWGFDGERIEGDGTVIEDPATYVDVTPEKRSVILKIHGLVDRFSADWRWDSFVITEDQYIEYLTRIELATLLPVHVVNRLKRSNFLFLGYSLRDWNVRALLHEIWAQQQKHYCSWAVVLSVDELDERSWRRRNVEIVEAPLAEYVTVLAERLAERLGVAVSA
jgi:SIR2-like protein